MGSSRTLLPDDIVLEILSRLPVNNVLKFQSVCQRWKALISTQYFKEMHLMKNCSPPMILAGRTDEKIEFISCDPSMILLDKSGLLQLQLDKSEAAPKEIAMRKVWPNLPSSFAFNFSYHGLIVLFKRYSFYQYLDYTILNPISGNNKVTISQVYSVFQICAMFFNASIKEYCVLFGSFQRGAKFKLLTLGAKPCFRDLKRPSIFARRPRYLPVVIDDDASIYWHLRPHDRYDLYHCFKGEFSSCENQIMAFDIKTEEFSLMPHPGPRDKDCPRGDPYYGLAHMNTHLVKMGGRLSYVKIKTEDQYIINIWTLKDSASRLWVKTHSSDICMNMNMNMKLRWSSVHFQNIVVEVVKGELLLHIRCPHHSFRGIYAYNLLLRNLREIDWRTYDYIPNIPICVPSFVSLPNHEILFPN